MKHPRKSPLVFTGNNILYILGGNDNKNNNVINGTCETLELETVTKNNFNVCDVYNIVYKNYFITRNSILNSAVLLT